MADPPAPAASHSQSTATPTSAGTSLSPPTDSFSNESEPPRDRGGRGRRSSSCDPDEGEGDAGPGSRKRRRRPQALFGGESDGSTATDSHSRSTESGRCLREAAAATTTTTTEAAPPLAPDFLPPSQSQETTLILPTSGSRPSRVPTEAAASVSSQTTGPQSLFGAVMRSVHSQGGRDNEDDDDLNTSRDAASMQRTPPPPAVAKKHSVGHFLDIVNALSPFHFASPPGKQPLPRRPGSAASSTHASPLKTLNGRLGYETPARGTGSRGAQQPRQEQSVAIQLQTCSGDDTGNGEVEAVLEMPLEDWTLKESLSLEYSVGNPAIAEARLPLHPLRPHARIEWLAQQQFLTGRPAAQGDRRGTVGAAVRLHQALLYWEYAAPTQHMDEKNLVKSNNMDMDKHGKALSDVTQSTKNNKHSLRNGVKGVLNAGIGVSQPPASNGAMKLHNGYRNSNQSGLGDSKEKPPPPFTASVASERLGDDRVSQEDPRRVWQEAVWSLYMSWIQHIRSLAAPWKDTTRCIDERTRLSQDECYFYAIGRGHSVLFRATSSAEVTTSSHHTSEQEFRDGSHPDRGGNDWVPQIVISSCSRFLREKLRQRAVRLTLLRSYEGVTDFVESLLEVPVSSNGDTDTECCLHEACDAPFASPATKAELIALRQSQAMGATVGLHVKVSMDERQRHRRAHELREAKKRHSQAIPPLVINGFDDCAAFLEVYLNMYGQVHYHDDDSMLSGKPPGQYDSNSKGCHLPILQCRRIGPFAHASLRKLRLSQGIPIGEDGSKAASSLKAEAGAQQHDCFNIKGLILPCALRTILEATVACAYGATTLGQKADGTSRSTHRSASKDGSPSSQSLLWLSDASSGSSKASEDASQMSSYVVLCAAIHPGLMEDDGDTAGIPSTRIRTTKRTAATSDMAGKLGLAGSQGMRASVAQSMSITAAWNSRQPNVVRFRSE